MNELEQGLKYQDGINNALSAACSSFRGTVSVDRYKNLILSMLFLKYLSDIWQDYYGDYESVYDSEQELIEDKRVNLKFYLPCEANFYNLYQHRHQPGNGMRINWAFHILEKVNGPQLKDDGISVFQHRSFITHEFGEGKQIDPILCRLLEDFAIPELILKPSRIGAFDVVGRAFEYLLEHFAVRVEAKSGVFHTPPELGKLITGLLDPQPGDRICDPSCGTGSILLECGKKVVTNHNSKDYSLHGQEVSGDLWSIAKMNMILHGEDNHNIKWGDIIRNPKFVDQNDGLLLFDVVISQPPFSLHNWGYEEAESDRFGRFHRGLPPKSKGIYAFILHMLATLKPETGRMAVVVPHGVLFRGFSEGKIRKKLIEENLLDAVISLPVKLCYGTNIPTVILVFKKTKKDNSVLFIDASREFKEGKHKNRLSDENIAKIATTYRDRLRKRRYAYLVSIEEIIENQYNLNFPLYVDFFEEQEQINLATERAEREHLMSQLIKLESEMKQCWDDLGYGKGE